MVLKNSIYQTKLNCKIWEKRDKIYNRRELTWYRDKCRKKY